MFKNTYQSGLLSIFYSCGSDPLALWDMEVNNGHIKRLTDKEVNSIVLEIVSTNVATTYITCPRSNKVLGIKLPFLVMIVKNLKRYFSFEITILDDKNMRRRFRISNFQSTTKIKPFCTYMPIGLAGGWNQIQFNLADFTRKAYGTQFMETLRVQVHANARLRRIYFSERLYTEEELPQEYKLFLPLDRKQKPKPEKKKDERTPVKTPSAVVEATPKPEAPAVQAPHVQAPGVETIASATALATPMSDISVESVAKSQGTASKTTVGTAAEVVGETIVGEAGEYVEEVNGEPLAGEEPDLEETGEPAAEGEVQAEEPVAEAEE